jgi:hypothetical protein
MACNIPFKINQIGGSEATYRETSAIPNLLDIPKISVENSRQQSAVYDDIIDRPPMDVNTISHVSVTMCR